MDKDIQVLVVGAGPTGLSMAIELLRHQIPFRIIDKKAAPVETSNALGVQPRTLEVWDDQGLIQTALEQGFPLKGITIHSQGKKIADINTYNLTTTLYPFILALPQFRTEQMLLEHLKNNNVTVEYQCKLTQVTERTDTVIAHIKNSAKEDEQIRVKWLIACDGIHSTVREQLHVPFQGKELIQHFMMGDVLFQNPVDFDKAQAFFNPKGTFAIIPYDTNKARILFDVTHDPQYQTLSKPTDEQLQQAMKERCAADIKIEKVFWKSGFHIQERMVTNYKHNNVFFAGDAAHVHSPAGGQGMNTGIQDVYNLAWKLAAVINGECKPSLLESYNAERYPIAKNILINTTMMTRIVTIHNKFITSLRNFFLKFFTKEKRMLGHFLESLTQLAINYEDSLLTKEYTPNHPAPKAGDRFFDCYIDKQNSDRLMNHVRGIKPTLLFFSGILKDQKTDVLNDLLSELHKKYGEKFNYILVTASDYKSPNAAVKTIYDEQQLVHRKYQVTLPFLYMLRPDKYFGFKGKLSDAQVLEEYLAHLYL